MAFAPILAGVGIASSIAGAATGALGAASGAASQSAMYNYQAGIAQQNAQIDKQNETYALQTGESQQQQSGMETRARLGQIRTAQGASGFDVNSGTNRDVQTSQQQIGGIEQANIRSNYAKQAYDYSIGALQSTEQASAYSASAANAQTAGNLGIATSIIGGAGSVASKWYQGSTSGLFGSPGLGG